jgi:hypothetical protein
MTAALVSESRFKQRAQKKNPQAEARGFSRVAEEDGQKLSFTPAVNAVLLLSA